MVVPLDKQLRHVIERKKKESLIYSVLDGSAYSIMAGFGENYLGPFVIELGASHQQIGLLSSVPQFLGSTSQLLSATLLDFFRRRKIFITLAVLAQALIWIPLMVLPAAPVSWWIPLALCLFTFFFFFGNFVSPAWNSLMGELVPAEKRGFFFGKRNNITGCITFLSVFAAGYILYYFQNSNVLLGFSLLFGIACIARLVSFGFLMQMIDLPYKPVHGQQVSFFSFVQSLHKNNAGLFILYLCLMNFSVQLAGPFFSAYMLRDLGFSYLEFMLVNVVATIITFLTMTYWGVSADYYGNRKIITITGVLLPLIPILWLFSQQVPYLMAIQVVSGFAWAGFNLASTNFLFDNTTSADRARSFAYYNVLNSASVFLGATLGGFLATQLTTSWIFASKLQILFLISGLLRAGVSFIFLPRIHEVRIVPEVQTRQLFWNLVAVRPFYGMCYDVVLGINKLEAIADKISNAVEERILDVEEKLLKKR